MRIKFFLFHMKYHSGALSVKEFLTEKYVHSDMLS